MALPRTTRPAFLRGFTALDLTDLKGQLCGRFLADLGMEVIKVELPEGDPVRRLRPFSKTSTAGHRDSLRFAHLNAGKKSVVIDYRHSDSREAFLELVAGADVVLESFAPGYLSSLGLGYHELAKVKPNLVMASITGFGQTGPHSHYACTDIVAYAMSGLMYLAGDPARAPVKPPETQAYYYGSLMGALGVVTALYQRQETGAGDWVDISLQEALATQESLIRLYANDGITLRRQGAKHAHIAPAKIFPCRDGYVYLYVNGTNWVKFLQIWTGHPADLDDPTLIAETTRAARGDYINAELEQFTRRYGKEELTQLLQSHKIPCVPVQKPTEWLADPQASARGFLDLQPVGSNKISTMGAPYLLNGERPYAGPAPALGEHQDKFIRNAPSSRTGDRPAPGQGNGSPPLTGMRVLSFDQVLAGPYGTNMLGAMGADIIKIESRGAGSRRAGLDPFRYFGATQDVEMSPRYFEFNRNKRSLTVNLKSEEGPDLIKKLSASCNAVMDNFAVHVMPSLGLAHPAFAEVRPDIVTLRMPGLGCTGPKNGYATLGPSILALIGFTYLWNHEGESDPPIGSQMVWPDYVSSLMAAVMLVAATLFQRRSGQGTSIDLSQAEAAAYFMGVSLMQAQESPDELAPMGNASFEAAPQGCYRTRGEDRWCVISIETEDQWMALIRSMGRPELQSEPRFSTLELRQSHRGELDVLIGSWTGAFDGAELMHMLQAVGVPCGVVQTSADLMADVHLQERGFIILQEHARVGRITLPDLPIRFLRSKLRQVWDFATLGQHNRDICAELLDLAPEEIDRLEAEGVLT